MLERANEARMDPEAGDEPSENQRTLEELRSLLFGSEQRELLTLRARLDNLEVRAKDVSEVVAEAIQLRGAADGDRELSRALAPTVEHALKESVRKDARVLAEALYPVMGPAIRKSIYESIRALIQSFNEALAQGLSLRGIKWRIEAIRTGRPFSEVVLLHTLVYRIEQTFLIHKKTGVLLHHLAMSSLGIQDPELVSGMLSAIQDFMRVSFDASRGASVNALQVGDLQVWIEQGPEAVLASVIRGHPPQSVRFKLSERLEQIHAAFGSALETFDGDASPFLSATEILADCLEGQIDEKQSFRGLRYVFALAFVVVALSLAWVTFSLAENRKWTNFVEDLRHEPGIVVTSFSKHGGRYQIRGLRDPQSADPQDVALKAGLDPRSAVFEWSPYYALDDALVLERVTLVLKPPDGVSLSFHSGSLRVAGECDETWGTRVRSIAPLIPGVRLVDDSQLKGLGPLGREKGVLQSIMVMFSVGSQRIQTDQQGRIVAASEAIRILLAKSRELHQSVLIEILGHTDSTGTETANSLLSGQRAENVLRALVQAGASPNLLRLRPVAGSEPVRQEKTETDRQYNRSVTFRVVSRGPGNKH